MKQFGLVLVLSLTLAACAPGALGPPPAGGTLRAGPYPATSRAAIPRGDGVFAHLGPDGPSLGLKLGPLLGETVGVGGWVGGAKVRGSWVQDAYAVSVEGAYLYYDTESWEGGYHTVRHRVLGLAADASYLWPVPVTHGSAYAGPRARAYWALERTGDSPYQPASAGLLPGVVLGVNLPVPATGDRLVFGLEASLFVVSPWLSSEADWSFFSPLSIAFSYRF